MGSYRRGSETSGDVDILITRANTDGKTHKGAIKKLVDKLKAKGVITHEVRPLLVFQSMKTLMPCCTNS